MNTVTWSCGFEVGSDLALKKNIVAKSQEVKTGPNMAESSKEGCGCKTGHLLLI
jgi:hypothetical protein